MNKFAARFLTLIVFVGVANMSFAQVPKPAAIYGFTDGSSVAERSAEAAFDSFLKADDLRVWLKRLSARPHHLGSPYDKENAEFIASQFRSWGYDTQIESFDVLFPTPKTRLVEMTSPEKFTLKLNESPVAGDPSTEQQSEQLPTYNAYSIDGDVTGQLVYVNYGRPADYEELDKHGISVRGKIVISRYGGSWRGIKPKVAAEQGAIGCIIYSDPLDDGYAQGDVYPKGAFRNENGVQRGSVMDMPLYPGDPLTKDIGAIKDAKRIDRKDAVTLTKIPVLPISYGDALPLLKSLDGDVVPRNWRGSLPITYHFGDKTPTVRMKLEFNWDIKPIYDVIAKMKGSEAPDEWIIRGNHHDAWVNGANDPLSGQVAMMEEARAISELVKTGWKPKRTLVFCAWDAEEEGLIGSTEWVETHADELSRKAVVYINSDTNGRGFFGAEGSHTLERFINDVARDIPDPETGLSVWERLRNTELTADAASRNEVLTRGDLRIGALGSGSDYTPFLQHLGIASLNIGFGGEDESGSYHSIYDTYAHYMRFGDPDLSYGITLSKAGGHAMMRMANADTLPFEFNNFAETVGRYVSEVEALADNMRSETRNTDHLLASGILKSVQDPKRNLTLPQPKDNVPYLNFAPLQNAFAKLQDSSRNYQRAVASKTSSVKDRRALDEILYRAERALIRPEGLPRRDWFKHQIYAPGFYTGYGVKTLPAIREAIEQRDWKEAEQQIEVVSKTLERFAAEIDRATAEL